MASREMQRAFLDVCFGTQAPDVGEVPREALVRAGVGREDIESLGTPRFWLYRRLIRHNVVDVIGNLLERTKMRLNAHAPGAFDAAIDAFLATERPKTHHLRDVPAELVRWVAPRWERREWFGAAKVPTYMIDFARYESEEFSTGTRLAPPPGAETLTDVDAAKPIVLHGSLALMTTRFPIHTIAPETDAAAVEPLEASETHYAFYRDVDHRVRVLTLTPFVATFARQAMEGAPLLACVQHAAGLHPVAGDVTAELAKILADWGERGLLLGGRA